MHRNFLWKACYADYSTKEPEQCVSFIQLKPISQTGCDNSTRAISSASINSLDPDMTTPFQFTRTVTSQFYRRKQILSLHMASLYG